MKSLSAKDYKAELTKRAKHSRIHYRHQLVGLEIAMHLEDEKHKSLYIKMAKEGNPDRLLAIAKDVAERNTLKNKGAYFMKIVHKEAKTDDKQKAAAIAAAYYLKRKK